jgi:hypothetical protein
VEEDIYELQPFLDSATSNTFDPSPPPIPPPPTSPWGLDDETFDAPDSSPNRQNEEPSPIDRPQTNQKNNAQKQKHHQLAPKYLKK